MNRRRLLGLSGLAAFGAQPICAVPVHAAQASRWQPDAAGLLELAF